MGIVNIVTLISLLLVSGGLILNWVQFKNSNKIKKQNS